MYLEFSCHGLKMKLEWNHICIRVFPRFLIKLDMKPHMHIVKINIFSLNNIPVRFTKIMNKFLENLKILIFKVIFLIGKLIKSFHFFLRNIGLWDQFLIKKIFWKFWFLEYFISKNVPNFVSSVLNFGRSEGDCI